jgi:hypothetical protein
MKFALGCGLAATLLGAAVAAQPRLAPVDPAAVPEAVFRWTTDRCDDWHIPDSPARALRLPDGQVVLLAAHLTNTLLLGPTLDRVAPACATMSRGAENPDPAAFDDRFWVQALLPLPDGQVLGLASHEYMGWRHGNCGGHPGDAFRCWYSALIVTLAQPGEWRFRPRPGAARLAAASPRPHDPALGRRSGFFSASNIVLEGEYAYFLGYTEGVAGQPAGNCLFRAARAALPGGWAALAADGFTRRYGDPYAAPQPAAPCTVVGAEVFGGPARALFRHGRAGDWVAVFTRADGVFQSVSADLRRWSDAAPLFRMTPFRGQPSAGIYYEYPALLDPASDAPLFDEFAGRPYLYLTRFNLGDRRRGLDRDLVRLPLRTLP